MFIAERIIYISFVNFEYAFFQNKYFLFLDASHVINSLEQVGSFTCCCLYLPVISAYICLVEPKIRVKQRNGTNICVCFANTSFSAQNILYALNFKFS